MSHVPHDLVDSPPDPALHGKPRTPPHVWDGLVVDAEGATVTVALLDGATVELRVVGPAVDIAVGEPVAFHPVAELAQRVGDPHDRARRIAERPPTNVSGRA